MFLRDLHYFLVWNLSLVFLPKLLNEDIPSLVVLGEDAPRCHS